MPNSAPPRLILLAGIIILLATMGGCKRWYVPSEKQLAEAVKAQVDKKDASEFLGDVDGASTLPAMLERFYVSRNYRPAWTPKGELPTRELLAALCRAGEDGLNPGEYGLERIARLHESIHSDHYRSRNKLAVEIAQMDLALTYALLAYGSHLTDGYALRQWHVQEDKTDLVAEIQNATGSQMLAPLIAGILPRHPQYGMLKAALARLRGFGTGDWPKVADAKDIANLSRRLAASQDLRPSEGGSAAALTAALKSVQRRHGLTENGKPDPPTLAALNVPLDRRIRQIEINLERWRWLPRDLGPTYILVNVPAFELRAVENGKVALKMPVVVGKEFNPTPLFGDTMTHIVLNPYWNIPPEIAQHETLPILVRDPGYLERNEIEVLRNGGDESVDPESIDWKSLDPEKFPYRLRQKPGDNNSLGKIKFMFPNAFDVYLHDTPADHLFNRKKRDYSHGCVRVAQPFELAAWLLKDNPEWTVESLKAATAPESEEDRTVKLDRAVPVYILYLTTWVEDDGRISFRDDLYDHDRQLLTRALRKPDEEQRTQRACQYLLQAAE